jgi:hypothetical protein
VLYPTSENEQVLYPTSGPLPLAMAYVFNSHRLFRAGREIRVISPGSPREAGDVSETRGSYSAVQKSGGIREISTAQNRLYFTQLVDKDKGQGPVACKHEIHLLTLDNRESTFGNKSPAREGGEQTAHVWEEVTCKKAGEHTRQGACALYRVRRIISLGCLDVDEGAKSRQYL